jgi:hypothetical protein
VEDAAGGEFSAEELCAMATRNPADALGWSARLGRLKEGLHGDVLVTTDRGGSAYRNLIESVERDVQLVAINGQPFYGTARLMKDAGATHDEPIRFGRLRRRVRLVYPGIKDADLGWAEALADIEEAKRDPVARYLEIERLHEVGDPPALASHRQAVGRSGGNGKAGARHGPDPAARLARPRRRLLPGRGARASPRRPARPSSLLLFPELIAGDLDPGSANRPRSRPPSRRVSSALPVPRAEVPLVVLDHGIDRNRRDEALLNEQRLERSRPQPRLVEVVAVGHARSR